MADTDFNEIDRAVGDTNSGGVATPATRRSSGRFMDMVHPASDMTSQRSASPREATPSVPVPGRQAGIPAPQPIPVPQPVSAPQPSFTPRPPSPAQTPVPAQPLAPPTSLTPEPQKPAMPSPSADEPASASEPTDSTPQPEPAPKPLDSPFLAGAMVEKRPLGGQPSQVIGDSQLSELGRLDRESEAAVMANSSLGGSNSDLANHSTDGGSLNQAFPNSSKKPSSLKVALIVLLLIILGAGAGLAFYFFILPML